MRDRISLQQSKTGGIVDIFDDDILIGDSSLITSQSDTSRGKEKSVSELELADWIEDMKSWPDLENKPKKYGKIMATKIINAFYTDLSIHMEYHLLHRRKLLYQVYSEPLVDLLPKVNVMLASHDFITRSYWSRIGYMWVERGFAENPDNFWGLVEHSHCFRQIQDIITQKKLNESKKAVNKQTDQNIKAIKNLLNDPSLPLNPIKSSAICHLDSSAAKVAQQNPYWVFVENFCGDWRSHFHQLLIEHSKYYVATHQEDKDFRKAFEAYIDACHTYNEQVGQDSNWQLIKLPSLHCKPSHSGKVGRPTKPTTPHLKRDRGRPPKGANRVERGL
jgi:hypothetical protein